MMATGFCAGLATILPFFLRLSQERTPLATAVVHGRASRTFGQKRRMSSAVANPIYIYFLTGENPNGQRWSLLNNHLITISRFVRLMVISPAAQAGSTITS